MRYVTLDEAIVVHEHMLSYGGRAGLRDRGLLDSALHAPQATFAGEDLYPDVWHKAAALLLGLTNNHPFVDGNKRTAAFVTLLFLRKNGIKLKPRHKVVEELVVAIADGRVRSLEVVAEKLFALTD
jgi:death-on-curing protein